MVNDQSLMNHWNQILDAENLGLMEKGNAIFPEFITPNYRRHKAIAWLGTFKIESLELIRSGRYRGEPNLAHKRVIELCAEGLSTRQIAETLGREGARVRERSYVGYQGVARILKRYLGDT